MVEQVEAGLENLVKSGFFSCTDTEQQPELDVAAPLSSVASCCGFNLAVFEAEFLCTRKQAWKFVLRCVPCTRVAGVFQCPVVTPEAQGLSCSETLQKSM